MSRYKIAATLAAMALLLSACSVGDDSQDGDDGRSAVVVAQAGEVGSLDNARIIGVDEYNVVLNIYDTLMMVDNDGELQPGLAVSAVQTDDLTWRVELRDGVQFHNGTALTAEDVKWSIERVLDPSTGSGQLSYIASIDQVELIDELVLDLHTAKPDPSLMMALQMVPIGSEAYFDEVGAETYGQQPVGTGPYQFVSWTAGDRVVMNAYADHWRGAPSIEEVTFRTIPNESSIVAALRAGEVDLITNVNPDLTAGLEGRDDLEVLTQGSNLSLMVTLDNSVPPFNDIRVRRALQYATDVPLIVDSVLSGYGTALPTLFGPEYLGYNDELEPIPFNPEESRRLLAEAGYADGVQITISAPRGRYLKDADVAQALAAQWQEAGFDVELNILESPQFLDRFVKNDLGNYLIAYGTPIFDSGKGFNAFFTCGGIGAGFCDQDLQDAVHSAIAVSDAEERAGRYREINARIAELQTHVFLYQQSDLYGASTRLVWSPRPDARVWLYQASIAD